MPLVNYSDSDSDSSAPPPKRLKSVAASQDTASIPSNSRARAETVPSQPKSSLPPLPAAFHDLYASTVRTSTVDDPSLHHGRRRQTPHVAGNWPSHLYIEWHPAEDQHTLLASLIAKAQSSLPNVILHTFLTSELGSPLPLHISLSRPIVLATSTKDTFLDRATQAIRDSAVRPFEVTPISLAWYHSPDSNRTFLILRVESDGGNKALVRLLIRCNAAVKEFGQPELYALRKDVDRCAFHVSVAWTAGNPIEECDTASEVGKLLDDGGFSAIKDWRIAVGGVKVKVGNKVVNVDLGRDLSS